MVLADGPSTLCPSTDLNTQKELIIIRFRAFATAIGLALLSAGPTLATAMVTTNETETNRQIVTDAFKTCEQGTYVFGELLSEDTVWTTHGPVVAGKDAEAACYAIEELEATAKLAMLTHGCNPRMLGAAEIRDVVTTFDVEWAD